MITVFDGIPEIFVERYDRCFQQWGREFRERGKSCAIAFDLMPGEAFAKDEMGRDIWQGAWLTAELERTGGGEMRMVVRPASDWYRHLIEVHCWKLHRWAKVTPFGG